MVRGKAAARRRLDRWADSERLPFRQALAEMARVLAPGGRLAIADGTADLRVARIADWLLRRVDHSHMRLYRTRELVELVEGAGFAKVSRPCSHPGNRDDGHGWD